ncbi:hypothetical protein [Massilia endophytica]|uniref:hypothetical protein n=1 Tax=Massilia endophytica TaxID=2899220 RepID=UPI001E52EB25|nr:hypothetical protein [Massilia endophytica]UGQ47423.1 hypothetical protein LSQ66_02770 [Massilia endophytica]
MKRRYHALVFTGIVTVAAWSSLRTPGPLPILSFRIGQPFEEVVKASTYPVLKRSNIPTNAYLQSGETFVTEPAVILRFNDPQHGFTLPPTKFAMLGYMDNEVETAATSPMLEKLQFEDAVAILENLQNQFKAGGWKPWEPDGSAWFDLSLEGKRHLYERMFRPGFSQEATLLVPGKYGMTFRLWCADGCMNRQPPYLFLIDIGVGRDIESRLTTVGSNVE